MSAPPGLELGPVADSELPAVAALAGAALVGGPDAAGLARERKAQGARLWVARWQGRVVAFVSAVRAADLLEITWLAVEGEARRRGIGRALIDALALSERALTAVRLDVRAGDATALAFYAATGFVAVGRRPRYYRDGEDAILMTRDS